jgi:leucyl aminopeptidase
MKINITIAEKLIAGAPFMLLADTGKPLSTSLLTTREKVYLASLREASPKQQFFVVPRMGQLVSVAFIDRGESLQMQHEAARRAGSKYSDLAGDHNLKSVTLATAGNLPFPLLAAAGEGLALASYRFLKYFSEENSAKREHPLESITMVHRSPDENLLRQIVAGIRYTFLTRDLVNEPGSAYHAAGMAELIVEHAKSLNIKGDVLNKRKIEALKMGGLLGVNRGSVDPPVFTVLEYKPDGALNTFPVVLVGKGLIFDTGGMNLKTGSFMDGMKSDMAGAATMAGAIMAAAAAGLPLHVIALLPSTDNRVNGNALVPGDVITMHDGTTVEVNNTDAEGRLILADALSYAKRYNPMLVIDAATLTGAAARAIGPYGLVAMQQNAGEWMSLLKEAGENAYERIAEFPMWNEYEELLKSDVADLSNVGGINAGAITAGKFLAHFTNYPFIHLDIAGPALADKKEHYKPKGGTGMGVRLLLQFLHLVAKSSK